MYAGKIEDSELFQIIYFEKLDVNDWKGDKIDEKAMITQKSRYSFLTAVNLINLQCVMMLP